MKYCNKLFAMLYSKGGSKKTSVKFPDNLIWGNQVIKLTYF